MKRQATTRHTTSPRPDYASLQRTADHLQVSVRTVRRMISRGEITGYRLGPRVIRVDLNEIDRIARVIPGVRPSRPRYDEQEA